jgi:hypothetical protein
MSVEEQPPAVRPVARPAPRRHVQAAVLAGCLAAFLVLIVASVVWLPAVVVELDRDPGAPGPLTQAEGVAARNGVRVILLQGVGGLALLLGAGTGAWATLRQIQVNQEGQITERFTRAIEQLGSAEVDVRIGGLYGLQRIAEDAVVEREPIVEVLSAYVRNRAPWPPQRQGRPAEPDGDGPDVQHLRVRAPDVQAAMAVLGGSADWRPRPAVLQIGAVDLRRAYLIRIDLSDTYLHGAQLDGAWLRGSRLHRVNLHEASVRGAHLRDVDLTRADLRKADLRASDLRGADLRRARLLGADLRGVLLDGAHLEGAVFDVATRWPEGFEPAADLVMVQD